MTLSLLFAFLGTACIILAPALLPRHVGARIDPARSAPGSGAAGISAPRRAYHARPALGGAIRGGPIGPGAACDGGS